MDKSQITIGGFVRHLYINKSQNLYVINLTETNVLVRYAVNNVFYTQELTLAEVELYDHQKAAMKINF